MSSFGYESTNGQFDPRRIASNYADGAENVRARFKLYEYAQFKDGWSGDISELAVNALHSVGALHPQAAVLDVGTSDGRLLNYIQVELEHEGELYGIDPHTKQFRDYSRSLFTVEDWQVAQTRLRTPGVNGTFVERLLEDAAALQWQPANSIKLAYGQANRLDNIKDNSFDVVLAMMMLYHLSPAERAETFNEFNRVTKDDGVVGVATSGAGNKSAHRKIEGLIAKRLGVTQPQNMNAGFTTEIAKEEVGRYYKHAYILEQNGDIVIDTRDRLEAYLRSLRSLRDQFEPVPQPDEFEAALMEVARPYIVGQIQKRGRFLDVMQRSAIVASQVELSQLPTYGFTSMD